MLISLNVGAQTISIQEQLTYGGDNLDFGQSLLLLSDGSIIIHGWSASGISGDKTLTSYGGSDLWMIKLNSDYSLAWQKEFGGSGSESGTMVIETSDGNLLLACSSDSPISGNKSVSGYGGSDIWVVKIDIDGNILWQDVYGGSGSDEFSSITEDSIGDVVFCGSSNSSISGNKSENSFGLKDFWIVKIDQTGNIIWDKTIGGSDQDKAYDISLDSFDNIFVSGDSFSNISGVKTQNAFGLNDYWIVKLNPNGNYQWDQTFGGDDAEYAPTTVFNQASIYIVGYSLSGDTGNKTVVGFGSADMWILKLDMTGAIIWQKTVGGTGIDSSGDLILSNDDQLLLFGTSDSDISGLKSENSISGSSDYWIVSLDTNGNFIWDKTLGGDQLDGAYSILEKSDNNYLLFGYSESNISGDKDENSRGLSDYWIVEITSNVGVEVIEKNDIIVYPNPTTGILNFSQSVNDFQVLNCTGEIVLKDSNNSTTSVNLEMLAPGLYYVSFIYDGNTYLQRVIVN